ncbi:MAG: hypothetical protein K6T85_03040 [Gorillibacterium sp.]|nr:hypothetical protein [Gorillibacterium sp.]
MLKRNWFSRLLFRIIPLFLLAGSIGFVHYTPAADAASASVAVNGAYYTVSNTALTSGTGTTSTLQFTLTLKNNGKATIKHSDYGVRVSTSSGSNISAKLLVNQTARVAAGKSLDYIYTAQVSSSTKLAQLKVVIFKWDASKASLMKDIGSLALTDSTAVASTTKTNINLNLVDSTLLTGSIINIEAVKSYLVNESGKVYLYTDLYATNNGKADITLPATLLYSLKNATQSFTTQLVYDNGGTIQPSERQKLTLKTQVSAGLSSKDMKLVVYTLIQSKPLILGSVSLTNTDKTVAIGAAQSYKAEQGNSTITFTVNTATQSKQSDGTHVVAEVEVSNTGKTIESIPTLAASFLSGSAESKAANKDTLEHPMELAAGATTTYYFQSVLTGTIDTSKLKLALFESKTSGNTTAASTPEASAGNSNAAVETESKTVSLPVAVATLSTIKTVVDSVGSTGKYTYGTPFSFISNSVIDTDVEVSLVDMRLYENTEMGYKTVIGKYKFTNKGDNPVAVPSLQTDLVGAMGTVYTGTAQVASVQQILPSTSYITSYSYILPDAETENTFQLKFLDQKTLANEKLTLGAYKLELQTTSYDQYIPYTLSLYPFEVSVTYSSVSWKYESNTDVYTGTLNMDLEVKTLERTMVDSNFNSLLFELVNSKGQIVSTATAIPLGGAQKLVRGSKAVTLSNIPFEAMHDETTLRISEIISTPSGTVKHLLKQLVNP